MHYSLIFNLVLALMTMFTESGVEKETYEHYRKIHYDEYENSRQDDDEIQEQPTEPIDTAAEEYQRMLSDQ